MNTADSSTQTEANVLVFEQSDKKKKIIRITTKVTLKSKAVLQKTTAAIRSFKLAQEASNVKNEVNVSGRNMKRKHSDCYTPGPQSKIARVEANSETSSQNKKQKNRRRRNRKSIEHSAISQIPSLLSSPSYQYSRQWTHFDHYSTSQYGEYPYNVRNSFNANMKFGFNFDQSYQPREAASSSQNPYYDVYY